MPSPFDDQPGQDPTLYLRAQARKARLEKGFPAYSPNSPGGSRYVTGPAGPADSLLKLLSRFLRPGGQTTPHTPDINKEGIEDEVDMGG